MLDRLRGGGRGALVEVRLNARLQPVHRGDRYEDPLAYWLEEHFTGTRVTGGGTLVSPEGEPLACALDVETTDGLDAVLDAIVLTLERVGAPRGSSLDVQGREPRPFGVTEGLALRLDGVGLASEVYQDNDINDLIDEVQAALAGIGELQSWWEGPTQTVLYLYGRAAATMLDALGPVLAANPLSHNAQLDQIA